MTSWLHNLVCSGSCLLCRELWQQIAFERNDPQLSPEIRVLPLPDITSFLKKKQDRFHLETAKKISCPVKVISIRIRSIFKALVSFSAFVRKSSAFSAIYFVYFYSSDECYLRHLLDLRRFAEWKISRLTSISVHLIENLQKKSSQV